MPGGSEPMMKAEATASPDIALIFSFISLRARSTVERLLSASARLPPVFCWIDRTMAKKRTSAGRHSLVHLLKGLIEGHAEPEAFDQAAEFGGEGLGALAADHPQAVVDRQAGFDAAHDDVCGVGKFLGELLDPARDQEAQHPPGQAEAR